MNLIKYLFVFLFLFSCSTQVKRVPSNQPLAQNRMEIFEEFHRDYFENRVYPFGVLRDENPDQLMKFDIVGRWDFSQQEHNWTIVDYYPDFENMSKSDWQQISRADRFEWFRNNVPEGLVNNVFYA